MFVMRPPVAAWAAATAREAPVARASSSGSIQGMGVIMTPSALEPRVRRSCDRRARGRREARRERGLDPVRAPEQLAALGGELHGERVAAGGGDGAPALGDH